MQKNSPDKNFEEAFRWAKQYLNSQSLNHEFTSYEIKSAVDDVCKLKLFQEINSQHLYEKLQQSCATKIKNQMGKVYGNDVQRWLDNEKSQIDWNYWEAYKNFLTNQKNMDLSVIAENSNVIDEILDLSGNPNTRSHSAKYGLVIGEVQSGKTLNYLGLVNKAIDVGYKIIIILAGGTELLRVQTQMRLAEGVIGHGAYTPVDEVIDVAKREPVGVGLHRHENYSVWSLTDENNDFSKFYLNRLISSKTPVNPPCILCMKKNVSTLKFVTQYFQSLQSNNQKNPMPCMLIDDEADYATIDTSKREKDALPSAINKSIRRLLNEFKVSTYVGYTATPFANVLMDYEKEDRVNWDLKKAEIDEFGKKTRVPEFIDQDKVPDLFPGNFIITMPINQSYMGLNYFFTNNDDDSENSTFNQNAVLDLDVEYDSDYASYLPTNAKSNHLEKLYDLELPDSLKESIRLFFLSCAVRISRGQKQQHCSMLINMTYINALQDPLVKLVEDYVKKLQARVDAVGKLKSLAKRNLEDFYDTYNYHYSSLDEPVENIINLLPEVIGSNGKFNTSRNIRKIYDNDKDFDRQLNYSQNKEYGLWVIAIGGFKLSRGLTLEGLTVSYFSRNASAEDSLLQMARWFGYRGEIDSNNYYGDLCKVFLNTNMIEYYTNISTTINELRDHIDYMSANNMTPYDFGMKIRYFPGTIHVTAANKRRDAKFLEEKISFWDHEHNPLRVKNDPAVNKNNLDITNNFLNEISENNISKPKKGSYVFDSVDHKDVLDYLKSLELVTGLNTPTDFIYKMIDKMSELKIDKFKVVLIGNQNPSKSDTYKPSFKFDNFNLIYGERAVRYSPDQDCYYSASSNFSSKSDLYLPLSDIAVKELKESGNKFRKSIRSHRERTYPVLFITPYVFRINTPKTKEKRYVFDGMPALTYYISTPTVENLSHLTNDEKNKIYTENSIQESYLINKVQELNSEPG